MRGRVKWAHPKAAPAPARRFKDEIYGQFARISKALATPRRLELLDLLSQAPRSVEALARQIDQTVANTSQHLQVLRAARLVEAERDGLFVIYRLADEGVSTLLLALRHLAEKRLAEIEHTKRAFLEQRDAMEPVDRESLLQRVRTGEAIVLDVRPFEEYRAGHIPGAISIPVPELRRKLKELPPNREIVAYCRGPYCVMAIEAVALLRAQGFRAVRLEEGVQDWRALGFHVTVDDQNPA